MGTASEHSPVGSLGHCPECETEITRAGVIIEYETGGGTEAFAECPGCRSVVRPV